MQAGLSAQAREGCHCHRFIALTPCASGIAFFLPDRVPMMQPLFLLFPRRSLTAVCDPTQ